MTKTAAKQNPVVSREVAAGEVDSWLDARKVRPSKREHLKNNIEELIDFMVDGIITIDPDDSFNITHKLMFPIGDKIEFKYKSRIQNFDITNRLKTAGSDQISRISAYIGALSGEGVGIIGKMDTEDYEIAAVIAVFFM